MRRPEHGPFDAGEIGTVSGLGVWDTDGLRGDVGVRLREVLDRFRGSLLGLPSLWVAGGVLLAVVATEIDHRNDDVGLLGVGSTVQSSRALLSAIATGTIAAASVVFSLTLVAVQLSSSAYSSRVLRTFLRDRVQQNVIGLVTASFAYSLLVLLQIRGPLDESGEPFVPRLSVFLALVLAIASLLGLIASINHTAQSLRVSNVTRKIVREVRDVIDERFPFESRNTVAIQAPREVPDRPRAPTDALVLEPDGVGAVVTSGRSGWVQQISVPALRAALEPGSTVRLDVAAGSYVQEDAPLLTVWPPPADSTAAARQQQQLRGAVAVGNERTLQQDVGFGLLMLEDIALRALSPGINDANTAIAVMPQLGELVLDILSRPLTPAQVSYEGCEIRRPSEPTYADYVGTAFDQIRRAAVDHVDVTATLIRTMHSVGDELLRRRRSSPPALDALRSQLDSIDEAISGIDLVTTDRTTLTGLLGAIGGAILDRRDDSPADLSTLGA